MSRLFFNARFLARVRGWAAASHYVAVGVTRAVSALVLLVVLWLCGEELE